MSKFEIKYINDKKSHQLKIIGDIPTVIHFLLRFIIFCQKIFRNNGKFVIKPESAKCGNAGHLLVLKDFTTNKIVCEKFLFDFKTFDFRKHLVVAELDTEKMHNINVYSSKTVNVKKSIEYNFKNIFLYTKFNIKQIINLKNKKNYKISQYFTSIILNTS